MRQVLIVCYDFPWISAAGVIRTYQFAKRLPEFGWRPIILTAQSRVMGRVDDIEVSDGPLGCPEFTAAAARFSLPFGAVTSLPQAALRGPEPEGRGLMTRFLNMAAQFAVPDGKIAWMFPAVKQGLRIARDFSLHACLSVSPRPTAHLAAYRLAQRLKIPWVADYALPWSDAYWLAGRPRVVQWLDEGIEERIVRSAQRLTVAYPELARRLGTRYGRGVADKTAVVSTGFDDELFAQLTPEAARKFTVVYPGNHFCEQGRGGEVFLDAVDQWIDCNPSLEGKVEFAFIGKSDEALLRHRQTLAHPRVIRLEPFMSHRACVQAILSSRLCIVNTVGHRIPAKVYECMRAGKWILALTEPGSDLEGVMRDYSRGIAVSPRDTAAIRGVLESAYRRSRMNAVEPRAADRTPPTPSSKCAAATLSGILTSLVAHSSNRSLNG